MTFAITGSELQRLFGEPPKAVFAQVPGTDRMAGRSHLDAAAAEARFTEDFGEPPTTFREVHVGEAKADGEGLDASFLPSSKKKVKGGKLQAGPEVKSRAATMQGPQVL